MRDLAPKREIIVVPDRLALAETAARRLIARIAANPVRPAVCLTGGSTPRQLYELLATSSWRAQIPWARVHWFMGDDRFVAHDDPLSNIGMARKEFLDACAPARNIHPIPINYATTDEAAEAYERELRTFHPLPLEEGSPLFDIVLMGVGPDGHTASLFPETSALSERQKWVIGIPHANVAPFVPRVSLTLPCLASTREMLFLVSGRDKKDILTRVIAAGDLPAARAQSAHGETIWLLDEAAAPNGGHHASAR
jgi:6-phosphogluconolactonase